MQRHPAVSRRKLLGGIVAGAGALIAGKAAQAACALTPRQMNGPFFPVAINDYDWDMTHMSGRRDRAEGDVIEIVGRGAVAQEGLRPSRLAEWTCSRPKSSEFHKLTGISIATPV